MVRRGDVAQAVVVHPVEEAVGVAAKARLNPKLKRQPRPSARSLRTNYAREPLKFKNELSTAIPIALVACRV